MATDNRLIFGIRAVLEAIKAGRDLDKVFLRHGGGSGMFTILRGELRKREIPFQQVPVAKLDRLTGKNHQGVVAWLSVIEYSDIGALLPAIFESGEDPLVLILDRISDVRNFGAIARSAECTGVHALVIPAGGSAAIGPDAVKTSAGALHRIPVCRHRDLGSVVRFLRESGLSVFAATEKSDRVLYRTDLSGPAAIIMGSEEKGISPGLLNMSDRTVSIPLLGSVGSFNVSVAAGIILYEVQRQRDTALPNRAATGG